MFLIKHAEMDGIVLLHFFFLLEIVLLAALIKFAIFWFQDQFLDNRDII